jgi:hypothetical protein
MQPDSRVRVEACPKGRGARANDVDLVAAAIERADDLKDVVGHSLG